jgi:hypothetical protein
MTTIQRPGRSGTLARTAVRPLLATLMWMVLAPGMVRAQDAAPDTSDWRPYVAGYYAHWMGDAWKEMDLSVYDRILYFTTRVDSLGLILTRNGWPEAWTGLDSAATAVGADLVPTVAMMERETILPVFADSLRWTRLVGEIDRLVAESGRSGIHLDIELFEPAPDSVVAGFASFLTALNDVLPDSVEISAFAPAFDVSRMFDLPALEPLVDAFYVQGYDLHWLDGPSAGPVAPMDGWGGANWQTILARYREAGIPDDRIVMTLPYYGYEWPVESTAFGAATTGRGHILTYARVDSTRLPDIQRSVEGRLEILGLLRDDISGSPFYTWMDSTGLYQGWFEDEESIGTKLDFIRLEQLGGAAVFLMGYDRGLFDPQLRAFRPRSGDPGPNRTP